MPDCEEKPPAGKVTFTASAKGGLLLTGKVAVGVQLWPAKPIFTDRLKGEVSMSLESYGGGEICGELPGEVVGAVLLD